MNLIAENSDCKDTMLFLYQPNKNETFFNLFYPYLVTNEMLINIPKKQPLNELTNLLIFPLAGANIHSIFNLTTIF